MEIPGEPTTGRGHMHISTLTKAKCSTLEAMTNIIEPVLIFFQMIIQTAVVTVLLEYFVFTGACSIGGV